MASKRQPSENAFGPAESRSLKARIFDLSESAAKQVLYGLVQHLLVCASVRTDVLRDAIDDAAKFTEVKKGA